jgi:hypothetical protein
LDDLPKSSAIRDNLEMSYLATNLLLHRHVLEGILTEAALAPLTGRVASNTLDCGRKAVQVAIKLVSSAQTCAPFNWSMLKQVLIGTILVIGAREVLEVDSKEVVCTLNDAMEIFARAAHTSESASRAFDIVSEIKRGM